MPRLTPAPHLHHVGLAPAEGRRSHATVCPVDQDLTYILDLLRSQVPGTIAWIPPAGYAHMTLDATEQTPPTLPALLDMPPVRWQAVAVSFTAYSIRLDVEADGWTAVLATLGLPERPCYITAGYALGQVDVPEAGDVSKAAGKQMLPYGVAGRIERRESGPDGRPFHTRTVMKAELAG